MEQDFTQFLGEYLDLVVNKLEEDNYKLLKEELKPYEDMRPSGKKRVIKIHKIKNKKLKIIWSYENYN